MDAGVAGQLGVERGGEDVALADQHRRAVELGQHLDPWPAPHDPRRSNENPTKIMVSNDSVGSFTDGLTWTVRGPVRKSIRSSSAVGCAV